MEGGSVINILLRRARDKDDKIRPRNIEIRKNTTKNRRKKKIHKQFQKSRQNGIQSRRHRSISLHEKKRSADTLTPKTTTKTTKNDNHNPNHSGDCNESFVRRNEANPREEKVKKNSLPSMELAINFSVYLSINQPISKPSIYLSM